MTSFRPLLPWLLRDCHLTVTEGVAIMIGRLAQDVEWLRDVAGLDGDAAARLAAPLRAAQAADLLVFTRWVLVMTNLSARCTPTPTRNSRRSGGCSSRATRSSRPGRAAHAGLGGEDPRRLRAVYYHTYLYGNLVASQLEAALGRVAGGLVGRREAGAFLAEHVFRPGESLRWDRLIEAATGEPLPRPTPHGTSRPGSRPERIPLVSGAVGLNHVSVVARDLDESVRFYVDVLGLEPLPTPDFAFPVQWLRAGSLQVHVFERPDAPPTYAHFALEVDDVVSVYERARELGILDHASFGYAIAELPGGEAQLYVRDPSGNLIELDHPDGTAAREQIDEMILLSDQLPRPDGPTPSSSPRPARGLIRIRARAWLPPQPAPCRLRALAKASSLRCGHGADLAWPETAPRGAHLHQASRCRDYEQVGVLLIGGWWPRAQMYGR